jgi:hypothetical protein
MRLTLTREQIPLARETVRALRIKAIRTSFPDVDGNIAELPGWKQWADGGLTKAVDHAWANALEAAITEAEGKDADPRQPGPVSDADERAFWREVFIRTYDGTPAPGYSATCADEALDRYRKAFCAGMPSDQKGAK